ncbi:MAG: hypothetical protein ABFD06_13895 [Smithella sp.]
MEIVHKALSVFKIGDLLSVRVEQNRFIAETSEPPFIRLNDFVVKTFREALVQLSSTGSHLNDFYTKK